MIILKQASLEQMDQRSGKTVSQLLEEYYEHGWLNFHRFYDAQNWSKIKMFENDPATVVSNGILRWGGDDVGAAKKRLLTWIASETNEQPVVYLEFGVREGVSMKWVSSAQRHPESRFFGFDTFEGLPDSWVPAWGGRKIANARSQGEMAVAMPRIEDSRVSLIKGLVQETLPPFLSSHSIESRLFVNVDTDIYSAALFLLTTLHPFLTNRTLIYFDELHDEMNEFAALNDYVRSYYVRDRFHLIARAYDAYLFEYLK